MSTMSETSFWGLKWNSDKFFTYHRQKAEFITSVNCNELLPNVLVWACLGIKQNVVKLNEPLKLNEIVANYFIQDNIHATS